MYKPKAAYQNRYSWAYHTLFRVIVGLTLNLDERDNLVKSMSLDGPVVSLVTLSEVGSRRLVAAEEPLEPVKTGLAKGATIGVEESTTMANRQVTLPRRRIGRQSFEVALRLSSFSIYTRNGKS